MRLSDTVSLLASGDAGCSYTHPNDCNVYAVRCGAQSLIIDTGVGIETQRLIENLLEDGFETGSLAAILLTHGHLDHAGGAAWLHRQLGIPVFAGVATARALESGDEEAISLAAAKRAGIYGDEFSFQPCPVDRRVNGGERFTIGDATVEVLETPGHSADHVTYLIHLGGRILAFPGDTVFHGGKILISDIPDCNPSKYADSLRRLAEVPIDGLFPGHSIWSIERGHLQVRRCLRSLDQLLLPQNLL